METSLKSTADKEPIQILIEAIKLGPFNQKEYDEFVKQSSEPINLDLPTDEIQRLTNNKMSGLYRMAMMNIHKDMIEPQDVINEIIVSFRAGAARTETK